jgi:5,10-methylenetetrahydrofolate reductase
MKISFECLPGELPSRELMAKVDAISVPHLTGTAFQLTTDMVNRINDANGFALAFPHIAARNLQSEEELLTGLNSMGQLRQVLIIGGSRIYGEVYHYADDVLHVLEEIGHTANRHCAVDPNLESYEAVLKNQYTRYDWGFNQLCINPKRMASFKKHTVYCVPSQTKPTGLAKFMRLCGIRKSLRGAWRNRKAFSYITGGRFDVNRFWREIGRLDNDVHFYAFGNMQTTVDDFRREFIEESTERKIT